MGNVGIGTTSPGAKLTIKDGNITIEGTGKFYGDGSALSGVTGTDSTKVFKAGDTMTGPLKIEADADPIIWIKSTVSAGALMRFEKNVGGSWNTGMKYDNKFVIAKESNEYFIIDNATGNVGIGTTGPLSKLDVNGGMAVGSYTGVSAAPSNGLIVSGNVGIGTTAPGAKLHVKNTTDTVVASFESDEGNKVVIDKDGKVGVGTVNPGQKLSVIGNASFGSGDLGGGILNLYGGSLIGNFPQTTFMNWLAGSPFGSGIVWQSQTAWSVAQSATTILSDPGNASYVLVKGTCGSSGNGDTFLDVVVASRTNAPTVLSSTTTRFSPAARTYSRNANWALDLSMASGTYTVMVVVINFPIN
jgi:hypothetical protein